MPYAHVSDLELYYEESGDGAAQPLVLLNGAGGTNDDPTGGWAGLVGVALRQRLRERGTPLHHETRDPSRDAAVCRR